MSLYGEASAHTALGEHKLHPIAKNAEAIFKHPQNRLRSVLNHLEQGRGDRFFETIQAHPPGTEMRRVTSVSAKPSCGI